MTRPRVAVVLSGFPRRSETFALNELLALDERRLLAGIFATKPGDPDALQPGCQRLLPQVELLPDGNPAEQGEALAHRLRQQRVTGIHAYFAHTPAAVGEHAATGLGIPFGFSVHARDARKVDGATLGARANRAACVVACNLDVAAELGRAGGRAHVVPHGVDLRRFTVTRQPEERPLRVLAVGRLVEKKGLDVLLDAIALVGEPVSLRIVGDGPARSRLSARIEALGIGDRVALAGSLTHSELPAEYASANVVVVPSIVDATGDRDGLPNVVLEAMASGRAVIGTEVGAITSAVRHGETGLVVPAGSATRLAGALRLLAWQQGWCDTMGLRGRHRVEREYDLRECAGRFAGLLEVAYA